jgi:hypothetical protein
VRGAQVLAAGVDRKHPRALGLPQRWDPLGPCLLQRPLSSDSPDFAPAYHSPFHHPFTSPVCPFPPCSALQLPLFPSFPPEWFFYGGGGASFAKGWDDYAGIELPLCYWEKEFQARNKMGCAPGHKMDAHTANNQMDIPLCYWEKEFQASRREPAQRDAYHEAPATHRNSRWTPSRTR